jgi:hypothetical protein
VSDETPVEEIPNEQVFVSAQKEPVRAVVLHVNYFGKVAHIALPTATARELAKSLVFFADGVDSDVAASN